MKRSKSSSSLLEVYSHFFSEEAYTQEKDIQVIMDKKFRINKRYIGGIVCAVLAGIILIIVLGLTFIGAIIAVLLAIAMLHVLRKLWRRYRFSRSSISREKRYEVRLSCLNDYLKHLKNSKMSLLDFQGILEKVFQEFLPALILQIHNVKLVPEIQTLVKFLKNDAVHSCLLNSAIQLELSINHNENPAIISARLRRFFIPVMHLLKQPKEKENQELEIVRRISDILSKEETQVLLLTNKIQNDELLKFVNPFWSIIEYNKEIQRSCKFISDTENFLNPNRRNLPEKLMHYRRNSMDDCEQGLKKKKEALIEKSSVFMLIRRCQETFFRVPNLNETVLEEYKPEFLSPKPEVMNSPLKFNEMSQSPMPSMMPKSIPRLFERDIGELNQTFRSDESENNDMDSMKEFKSRDQPIADNSIVIGFSEGSEQKSEEENLPVVHPYLDCFEQLLQIEREPNSEKVWRLVVNKPETKVYQRKVGDSPICMIKAFCEVKYSARTVYTAIWDTSIRTKWDAVFNEFRLIESLSDSEYLYFMIRTPFGITKRDWLQRRVEIHDYPEPGTIILHFVSAEHPAMPPKKGVIRAETLISGYIIRPTGENTCKVMIVSQNDIKGLIPKALVNSVASKAPADWVNSMNKGCKMVAGY